VNTAPKEEEIDQQRRAIETRASQAESAEMTRRIYVELLILAHLPVRRVRSVRRAPPATPGETSRRAFHETATRARLRRPEGRCSHRQNRRIDTEHGVSLDALEHVADERDRSNPETRQRYALNDPEYENEPKNGGAGQCHLHRGSKARDSIGGRVVAPLGL